MTNMRETGSADRYLFNDRRLNYGNIKLVPLFTEQFPYNREANWDLWHVPGRKLMSTDALVRLATSRGITVTVSESEGAFVTTTRLN